jgi:hypothetical protein
VAGDILFAGVGVNELHVIAGGDETELHAFGLFGDRKIDAASGGADFVFGEFAEREFAGGQLFLGESPEKIGLVFGFVASAEKFPAVSGFVFADARVVAGGQSFGADLAGHAEQRGKLDVGVAIGAGDGSAAGKILVDEGADDAGFEFVFEIYDVVGEVEVLRDALGVVDVVDRATAMLFGRVGLQGGEAALIPELHGEADYFARLFLEEGGYYGAVDTAAHGHGDECPTRCLPCAVDGIGLECGVHGFEGDISIVPKGRDSTKPDVWARNRCG